MGNGRDTGPSSLYAALVAAPLVRILNAETRPTKRELLLEVMVIATLLEANNGSLRFPKALLDQADMARLAGRRLAFTFDEVTHEYVLDLTRPTEPGHGSGQQQLVP